MPIVLDRLSKGFGRQSVLDRVSLEVRDGELFVLLGASGSGKSTILRLIAGLLPVDRGRIVLHGRDVTSLPPQQRGTGFVFQNYSIFRHMSVAENIEFGLKIRRVPAADRARKRDELLDLVGLMGLGSRYADQLSGGQLQRVALARALAYEPSVLLLDEPFGALDVRIRAQLRRSLKGIQRRLQVATILVTHDQDEAFELGDRIGVLERGRLLEVGEPEALYARPRTLAVATFLGGGTVLAARAQDGRLQFGALDLPIPPEVLHQESDWVTMLVRPEHIHLSAEQPCAGSAAPREAYSASNRSEGTFRDAAVVREVVPHRQADPPSYVDLETHVEGPGRLLLGRGTVVEQSFAGAYRRLRLRLPRLPAARQVAPALPFGEEGMLVDALLPAEAPLPTNELWVGLRDWHILEAPPARLLVYDTADGDGAVLATACAVAAAIGAAVTLLGVAEHPDATEPLRAALERRREEQACERAEVKIRNGDPARQIAVEQQETFYELLVLAAADRVTGHAARPGRLIVNLLQRPLTPILAMNGAPRGQRTPGGPGTPGAPVSLGAPQPFQRLLICTRAGEPGKSDVRVGGWLARRLGAAVTLLYVTRGEAEPDPLVRGHLDHAAATLRALEVPADVRYRPAVVPVEGILEEARAGSYDVTVVGSHGPQSRSALGRDDVTLQIVTRAERPVLVVPAEE